MLRTKGYAVKGAESGFAPFEFERRELKAKDVLIEIMYCGVCRMDIHQVRNEWGNSIYPMVPGHEIVGRVKQIGAEVTKFKEGDYAGVVNIPANAPHFFQNASDRPARLLCMCSPAGQEEFFMEVGVPVASRTTPALKLDEAAQAAFMAKAEALAPKYRTELLQPA
jgi:hypothetical protein